MKDIQGTRKKRNFWRRTIKPKLTVRKSQKELNVILIRTTVLRLQRFMLEEKKDDHNLQKERKKALYKEFDLSIRR